jgi:hypothetical protein
VSNNAVRVKSPSGWVDLAYLATGPQGAQGVQGPQGAVGPQGPQGASGAGLLAAYIKEGANNAYTAAASGAAVYASGSDLLSWNYTPSVNVWVEVHVTIALLQALSAAYFYSNPVLQCTPAPPIGSSQASVGYIMQHASVQTFEAYHVTKLWGLTAGVSYQMYSSFSFSGGSWQYHQGAANLWIQGKAWAR